MPRICGSAGRSDPLATVVVAVLCATSTGCVGELRHAKQPQPLLAKPSRFADPSVRAPRLAREQWVGFAGFVGEDDFSRSTELKELLEANGIGSARSCSLGCTVAVRRDNVDAAVAIVVADGRFLESLAPEFMPPLPSEGR